MKNDEYIKKNPDGSITLCCRKTNRCPTLIQESEDKFKIIDDFGSEAFFTRKRLEESISQISLQESIDPNYFNNEEYISLEGELFSMKNNDALNDDFLSKEEKPKILVTRENITSLEKALETFDE